MLKKFLPVTALICWLTANTTPSLATDFKPGDVAENADWVVHMNLETGVDADFFSAISKSDIPGQPSRLAGWVSQRYGIEIDEFDGLTVYGTGDDQPHTVSLFYGNVYEEKLSDKLKQQAGASQQKIGDVTLYSWSMMNGDKPNRSPANQPGQRATTPQSNQGNQNEKLVTAAILDDLVLIADGVESAKEAVNAIKNQQGLSEDFGVKLRQSVEGDVALFAAILDMGSTRSMSQRTGNQQVANNQSANNQRTSADAWSMFGELKTASIAIGQTKGSSNEGFIAVEAQAESEQAARNVSNIVDGLQAMIQLSGTTDELDLRSLEADIEQEGPFLRIGWTVSVDQISQMISKHMEGYWAEQENNQQPSTEQGNNLRGDNVSRNPRPGSSQPAPQR